MSEHEIAYWKIVGPNGKVYPRRYETKEAADAIRNAAARSDWRVVPMNKTGKIVHEAPLFLNRERYNRLVRGEITSEQYVTELLAEQERLVFGMQRDSRYRKRRHRRSPAPESEAEHRPRSRRLARWLHQRL